MSLTGIPQGAGCISLVYVTDHRSATARVYGTWICENYCLLSGYVLLVLKKKPAFCGLLLVQVLVRLFTNYYFLSANKTIGCYLNKINTTAKC
ncbi:MAG: hypothetical protein EAY81_05600 [Bacteroidetes bacterium]|nr:MAG: hypothetical protein EAY81_05600 [Bacteroidota bacterium]